MSADAPGREDLTDAIFKKIARYVYEHAGINLTENKRELVRARLGKVIRQKGLSGYREYYEYMVNDETGEATKEVLNAVSTNLTSFFRESKHFDFLREMLLPEVARRAAATGTYRLRGWSAGCSTGEEVYTIALTLREYLSEFPRWDAKLLATDIDTTVIEHGIAGIYEEKRLATVPKTMLGQYFQRGTKNRTLYRLNSEIRRLVSFKYLNLITPWPFRGQFDFIFCRNVMIYFDRPTQQMLVDRFTQHLKPGGYLFIGHSEGLTGVRHELRYMQPTIYRK